MRKLVRVEAFLVALFLFAVHYLAVARGGIEIAVGRGVERRHAIDRRRPYWTRHGSPCGIP